MKGLILALLLAGCAAVAADEAPLPLPAPAREAAIPGPGGVTLRAWVLAPPNPSRPPVVALHGCGGIGTGAQPLRPGSRERDWAARLAAAGHPVVMPDSFGSRGLPDACGVRGFPAGPFRLRRDDALAAAEWARAQGWGAPVLLGWSHGGSTVLAAWGAAAPGAILGAVAFYPGCVGAPPPEGGTPMLMLLGGADDWTRPQPCEAWAARSPRVARTTFPGAHHGFDRLAGGLRQQHLPDGRSVTYGADGPARAEARRLVGEFLATLP